MKKYKIGYTTGVFDLFHIGHLNILKKAKERCDYLIVGISTDEVVQGYKNKKPVIPYDERVSIVEAIKYVDKVVPQNSMDKFEAWEKLQFNAIFHGDDWKGSKMYEEIERKFSDVGVDIIYFPYTKRTSSTILGEALTKVLDGKKITK
jgi:glycerol-3-phosphate cytidylyltransferase